MPTIIKRCIINYLFNIFNILKTLEAPNNFTFMTKSINVEKNIKIYNIPSVDKILASH